MRILVDYRPALRERTGVGEYIHQLVRAYTAAHADDEVLLFTSSWKDRPAAGVATETRASDNLVVLHFEYRTYPFITASSAYLASRCEPLNQIDPKAISAGRGSDTESELKYLRSEAQPPC